VTSLPVPDEVSTETDYVSSESASALHGLLDAPGDAPGNGDPLPPMWHWLAFLTCTSQRDIGTDGHLKVDPVFHADGFPRRMFAGARLSFPGAARVGEPLTRHSRVVSITRKTGRSGELMFVTVQNEILSNGEVVIREEQDIVYRPSMVAPSPEPTPKLTEIPPKWIWRIALTTDAVLLFRYSALTYNAHRIHYDWRYVTEVEGYPGLVVQGPLQAIGLAEVYRRNEQERRLASFHFRAMRPAFGGESIQLCGYRDESAVNFAVFDSYGRETVVAIGEERVEGDRS
jgi:3-methylfumaryl-CoA hydratase